MIESSLLEAVEMFAHLTDEEMSALIDVAEARELRRNDSLFSEGDESSELFVVVEGRLAIVKRSPDGRESLIALMERGDLFGEMPLFDGEGRSAEARALEPSEVIVIPYRALRDVYAARPELLWSVSEMLTRRLRHLDEALADSMFLDVTGRTAKRLLELANGAEEFSLPITQEELAGMVGASRERVNKAIASFIRLGWLDQHDRRYRILDRLQLERRST